MLECCFVGVHLLAGVGKETPATKGKAKQPKETLINLGDTTTEKQHTPARRLANEGTCLSKEKPRGELARCQEHSAFGVLSAVGDAAQVFLFSAKRG